MKVVVLANMRWRMLSPSLYQLICGPSGPMEYPIHLGYSGEAWFLAGGDIVVTVPDRDTGAMMLAKQLNAQHHGT